MIPNVHLCDMCLRMCVYILACVSEGLCRSQLTYGGQKTATNVSPHLPSCLRRDHLMLTTGCARLACQQASRIFHPTSCFVARSRGLQMCTTMPGFFMQVLGIQTQFLGLARQILQPPSHLPAQKCHVPTHQALPSNPLSPLGVSSPTSLVGNEVPRGER